jgi:hypothetical protein
MLRGGPTTDDALTSSVPAPPGPNERLLTAEPPATPSPQAWCRRILTALSQRKLQTREAGELEMMLVSFIEMAPAPEAFDKLLARYVADARPGIAEAATLLQRSWRQGQFQAEAEPRITLEETLRVLGGLLDDARARAAFVVLTPDGAQMQAFGETHQWELTTADIARESAARSALRGQVQVGDVTVPDRLERALRAAGAALETEPQQTYELAVTHRALVAEGSAGYFHVFSFDELAVLLRAAIEQRQARGL